jgi:hypothetical protein
MTEQSRIVHGTPTLHARLRSRVGGAVCVYLGHRPHLVIKTYRVRTGLAIQVGEMRVLWDRPRVLVYGFPTEESSSRAVVWRRCWVTCGGSIVEDGR